MLKKVELQGPTYAFFTRRKQVFLGFIEAAGGKQLY